MSFVLIATLSLLPFVFLPLTQDMFIPVKWTVLTLGALLILFLWALGLARTGEARVSVSKTAVGLGALSIAAIISLVISSRSRVEALTDPFGPVAWIAWTTLMLFGAPAIGSKKLLSWVMLLVASALSVSSILSHLGILSAVSPTIAFLSQRSWTPVGNINAIPWIALACLPMLLTEGTSAWKKRDALLLFCVIIVSAVLVAGSSFYAVLPAGERIALPTGESWRVVTQSWSLPLRAVFGAGIENYVSAFTQGRSALLNSSPLWNIRFAQSNALVFHLGTTLGFLGLLGLGLLARVSFGWKNAAALATLLLAPPSIPVLSFLVAAYLVTTDQGKILTIRVPSHLSWIRGAVVLLALIIFIVGGYFAGRMLVAELAFMRSLEARAANDGESTYNLQIEALNLYPANTRFRIAYSLTNLDIANAIASSARQQNTATTSAQTLSDADRQTITTLIQQAIREAKIAVNLSPQNPLAWENLARLYHNLVSVADGADQWAALAYQQTITLDPTNPLIRLSFATLLGDLGDTDNAFREFQNAVALKSDYALAHYNLAQIYRDRQQYMLEAQALVATLQAVTKGTDDEREVRTELEVAKARLTDQERTQIDQLQGDAATNVSELTSPISETQEELEPKLDLPEEASPPTQVSL